MRASFVPRLLISLSLPFAAAAQEDAAHQGEARPVAVEAQEASAPALPGAALTLPPPPPGVNRLTERDALPGTFGDPLRGVLLLPGVTHLASGVAHPVIRGLQPATASLLLDGVKVPMPFHLLAGPSTIHPAFLGDLDVQNGVSPVDSGRHLGATLSASGPRPHDFDRLQLSADLLNVGGFWQLPVTSTGTEVAVAGRLGWTPFLGALVANAIRPGETLSGELYDYQALIRQQAGPVSLRLLAFGAGSRVGQVVQNGGDTIIPHDGFHRVDLRASAPLGAAVAEAAVTWGVERVGIEVGGGDVFGLQAQDMVLGGRAQVSVPVGEHLTLRIGGDVERRTPMTVQRSVLDPPVVDGEAGSAPLISVASQPLGPLLLAGGYVGAAVSFGETRLEPSVRLDSHAVGAYAPLWAFEPRLQARHRLSADTLLTGAFGVQHQLPTTLIPLPAIEAARAPMGLQELYKAELGVDQRLGRFTGRASLFGYRLGRVIELSPFDPHFQRHISWDLDVMASALADRVENGYAAGLELLVRGEVLPNLSGFVSYSFQKSLRNTAFTPLDAQGQPSGARTRALLASPLEREHVLNVVGNWTIGGGWTLGANLHFNSGFPEAGNVASSTHVQGTNTAGDPDWIPVSRENVGRMPAYWRIDARVAKRWNNPMGYVEAYLDVLNLTVNQETLRFNYNERTEEDGSVTLERGEMRFPVILPMIGVRAEL